MKENIENKELYETLVSINKELDEVLEILEKPIKKYNKKKENLNEKIIEDELPEIEKKRNVCCC